MQDSKNWWLAWILIGSTVSSIVFPSVAAAADLDAESQLQFGRDFSVLLSKAGCNSGPCHGNQNGKGGFRLSLRGEDPLFDFQQLARGSGGRRLNRFHPDQSLAFLKATGRLVHQGGKRFAKDSRLAKLFLKWVEQGAAGPRSTDARLVRLQVEPKNAVIRFPDTNVGLTVTAYFDDGQVRDVTADAVYEPNRLQFSVTDDGLVSSPSPGQVTVGVRYLNQQSAASLSFIRPVTNYRWKAPTADNVVDRLTHAQWEQLRLQPSPPCNDGQFVRRVFLDLLGILPTPVEAKAFVADETPNKRSRLIDSLLARSEFAEHWALKWSDLLKNEDKVLDQTGVAAFHGWLKQGFANDRPIDQMVQALLTTDGSTYKHPAANYFRANRTATIRAELTARLFLEYACNVPSVTITRSINGRKPTITAGLRCLTGSSTKSTATNAKTASTKTSSPVSKRFNSLPPSHWHIPARASRSS